VASELRVPAAAAGERLDRFLAAAVGSRSRAQRLIDSGRVAVDGVPRPKRHLLAGGETVSIDDVTPAARDTAATTAAVRIVHEDRHLLVVDKPAGVVVHPARGHREGTLAQALAGVAGGGEVGRPGIVHRLDKDTSGLLVVARDEATHRALRAAIAARRVRREYLALALGRPPARSGTIDAPLGRDRRRRTRQSIDTDAPRDAVTHFAIERALPEATLLRVTLETGRTHQIRAHLEAIGHPVAGDREYGGADAFGLGRQFLHATRLAFDHPVTGERVDVTSPLPSDLVAALDRAARPD